VEREADMKESMTAADEVLAHSEDDGEWEDEPEQIESRPSGTQVISARLPAPPAKALLNEASSRGIRPSEIVRQAVESYMRSGAGRLASFTAQGARISVSTQLRAQPTENPNLVVAPAEFQAPDGFELADWRS